MSECAGHPCREGAGCHNPWCPFADDRVVVSHWPPTKPERPVKREPSKRPLTGLPAMMWDLVEASDRHDKLKREAGR